MRGQPPRDTQCQRASTNAYEGKTNAIYFLKCSIFLTYYHAELLDFVIDKFV